MSLPALETERLLLRGWRADDVEPFAACNADPRVAEHLPAPLTRTQTEAFVARIEAHARRHGFGLWAVERRADGALLGFTGLSVPGFAAVFTPSVEVGWRLAAEHWGHGYATEAARAALAHGFEVVGLGRIVSFTVPANTRSLAVMRRLGLRAVGAFTHPRLPPADRLGPHVLHAITDRQWRATL